MPNVSNVTQNIARNGSDICDELVQKYIGAIPHDPLMTDASNIRADGLVIDGCTPDYDSGYTISKNNGTYTLSAPQAEGGEEISVSFKEDL